MYNEFKSYMKDVEKQILKADMALRSRAADVVIAELKNMLNNPSGDLPKTVTGNLKKGIAKKNQQYSTIVGFKAPAHHAALVEYGHEIISHGKSTGKRAKPHPFLKPAFLHKEREIINILSESRT
ncbi:MAG: HK97 gp10 family phage protein [Chitinispirillales bacterium]|jgi:HK97 gp10 family phage protein|nr:HK97 gp10 family phage protein [Chitinispirillales bacterium]